MTGGSDPEARTPGSEPPAALPEPAPPEARPVPVAELLAEETPTEDAAPVRRRLADSRAFVYVMLFVVLGPLGLPFLFASRAFSRRAKVLLTAIVLALTALLVIETVYTFPHLVEAVQLVRERLRGT